MEHRGSEIKKILKEYDEENIPQFYSDHQYFIVALKNKNFSVSQKANVAFVEQQIKEQKDQESPEKILKIIAEDKNITTASIAKRIGLSTRAVEKQVSKLKESGALTRVGAKKGGYWEIVKHDGV